MGFDTGRWYRVRLRVTAAAIEASLDDQKIIEQPRAGHTFTPGTAYGPIPGLGVCGWRRSVALRNIRLRRLAPEAEPRGEAPAAGEWQSLFDGKTLRGWKAPEQFPVPAIGGSGRPGRVQVRKESILLEVGDPITAIGWSEDFPRTNYDLSLDAMYVDGKGYVCGVVFPIGDAPCFLGVGWASGTVVGLQYIDGREAHDNLTTVPMQFLRGQWYTVQLRVRESRVGVWIDGKQVIDFRPEGYRISRAASWKPVEPFGIGTQKSTSAFRNIRLRRLD